MKGPWAAVDPCCCSNANSAFRVMDKTPAPGRCHQATVGPVTQEAPPGRRSRRIPMDLPKTQNSSVRPQHLVDVYSTADQHCPPHGATCGHASRAGLVRDPLHGGHRHRARGERGEWPGLIVAALSLRCSTVAPRMCRAKIRRRRRLWPEPNTLCPSTQRPSLDAVGGGSCAPVPPRSRHKRDAVRSCAATCLAEPLTSLHRQPPGTSARAAAGRAAESPCPAGAPRMMPGRNLPGCFPRACIYVQD